MKRWLHRHGFGIQSPFAYEWVRDVLFEKLSYYAYDELRQKHHSGELSTWDSSRDEQLFRIANRLKPSSILLIGDIAEGSRDYITSPCKKADCVAMSCDELKKGGQGLSSHRCFSLIMCQSETDMSEEYQYLKDEGHIGETTVMIVEDIAGGQRLMWQNIVADPRAIITFDMKYRGVVFFDSSRVKQNYEL